MDAMRLFACLVIIQSRAIAMVSSLINDDTKTVIGGSVSDLCLWLGPPWLNWGGGGGGSSALIVC